MFPLKGEWKQSMVSNILFDEPTEAMDILDLLGGSIDTSIEETM
jgi:hypothetical protein